MTNETVKTETNQTYQCDVKIVDAIMGSGKSTAAINYINNADNDERFMVITPYLDEVQRYKDACSNKKFKSPTWKNGSKKEGLKYLINCGYNIVSTHALFQKFDKELIDMCRAKNYTLIMDEVADVVSQYEISKDDFEILCRDFVDVDEETNLITWRETESKYKGKFDEVKRLCELGSLAYYSGSIMMWLFPIQAFNAFRSIYILTYMFNGQVQRYYYDFYKLPYEYMSVGVDSQGLSTFCKEKVELQSVDYSSLIHILDNKNMNMIGDRTADLSKAWFERNKDNVTMKQLKNHIVNYFTNIRKVPSGRIIWTTFKECKKTLSGKGYTKGFIPLNMRATNEYRNRDNLAYIANRYMNPFIKAFFNKHNVETDENTYALSELLQFIWRSAIRDGKEIWIYIPSVRMRKLLENWIKQNSKTSTEIRE